MSEATEGSSHTVPTVSPRQPSKWCCAIVFVITAAGVYWWGWTGAGLASRARKYSSTAEVRLRSAPGTARTSNPSPALIFPDEETIERSIGSATNLRRALGQLPSATDPKTRKGPAQVTDQDIERVRKQLCISTVDNPTTGDVQISVTHTSEDPRFSALLVNHLAEQYAEDLRLRWKTDLDAAHVAAEEAVDRTEADRLAIEAQLDAFVQRCLKQTTAAVPSGPVGEPPPPNDPPETENPQWTALSEQLSELQRRRDEMLTDRTAAHPEVQHIGIRIAAIVQRLAATPRTLRANRSDQDGLTGERHPAQPPRLIDAEPGPERPPETIASEEYRELRESARRAGDEHQRALSAARQAWETAQLKPQIELVLAEASKPSEPQFGGGLVLASLAAGAGTAGGAAMVSAAAAMVPVLTTVAEVEAALPVPIVGTIPATDPVDRTRKARRRSRLIRWTMLLGGLLLIALCVGGVLTAWAAPHTG